MKKAGWVLIAMLMSCVSAKAQHAMVGEWKGAIDVAGQQLQVIFHLEGEPGSYSGSLDIPQQGAFGLAFTTAEQTQDSVYLVFNAGPVQGSFSGSMTKDSLIIGTYTQGANSFPFQVKRQKVQENTSEPGQGEELLIPNGDLTIAGTLVVPGHTKKAPLIILISGSGAQNRDENIFNFKPFAILADSFKQAGIASFRYDDRQVGKSTGSFADATLSDLASDVDVIINYLNNSYDAFNVSEIILLGHSQGGVVAGKVANKNDAVNKLILMASTGVSLKDVLRFQVKQAYGVGVYPKEKVEQEIALREAIMHAIQKGQGVEEAQKAYAKFYRSMLNSLPEAQKSAIPNIDELVERQASQLVQVYSSPQMQSLLFYDPAQDLENLNIPVLVLFGSKDTQVTETLNRPPIQKALDKSGTRYEIKVIPNANHLFQKANTGQVSEYATLKKEFIPGYVETLIKWMKSSKK